MSSKYHAALFDLDNLLVDTEPWHFQSYSTVMEELGIVITPEDRLKAIGVPAGVNIARVLKEHGRTDIDASLVTRKRQNMYLELIAQHPVQLMDGAHDLVAWLVKHGVPRIIASSSTRDQVALTLKSAGLTSAFEYFVSFEDVENGKPAPDIYIAAAARLGVAPAHCVVFEDASSGIEAGHAAGCYTVAVPNTYTQKGDFSKADLVVSSLADVQQDLLFS